MIFKKVQEDAAKVIELCDQVLKKIGIKNIQEAEKIYQKNKKRKNMV